MSLDSLNGSDQAVKTTIDREDFVEWMREM
jgi:hypothetical protein